MNISFDSIVGLLAPHVCLSCGTEGSVLCHTCIDTYFDFVPSQCAGCHALAEGFLTCKTCRSWLPLKHVYFSSRYSGVTEQLVSELKFSYRRQAAESIAYILTKSIPEDKENLLLCPIPTAPSRIRQRSFDHCKLLVKELSKKSGIQYKNLLIRTSNSRQVGSSRSDRIKHMESEFQIKNTRKLKGKKVLIVDDVMTTGATLGAAARILKKAGAKEVSAIILARK